MSYSVQYFGANNYYPFGMVMPGRSYTSSGGEYRFGFNGHEIDSEWTSDASHLDFGARIYDSRLGRFLSTDPWEDKYAWQTPYAYFSNSPISTIDYLGLGGDVSLNEEDGTATVSAQVHFIQDGSVSDEEFDSYIENYTNNLEQNFQNRTYTKDGNTYDVVLNITYSVVNNQSAVSNPSSSDNFVTVRSGGGISNAQKGGVLASMNINDGGNTATHEFLHLLGLDDRYQYAQSANSSGEVNVGFISVSMPRGQVNEPEGYDPINNIMANGATSGITNLQWDIIFSGNIENTNQSTIFYKGIYKSGPVLGIVNSNIIGRNNVILATNRFHGYLSEDGSVRDDGRYFVQMKKSFGTTVSKYFSETTNRVNGAISRQNFMAPYNR